MVAMGFSIAGASRFFDTYRWAFLTLATVLLGVGFYLNYRPQRDCDIDGNCPPSPPVSRLWNRSLLWLSAALVLAFALFPNYVGQLIGPTSTASGDEELSQIVLSIDGMTCTGCESAVEAALMELPEIAAAEVSYERGEGIITVAGGAMPSQMELTAAVGKAGYTVDSIAAAKPEEKRDLLSGQWITELEEQNGDIVEVVMDLGVVNSRWVGEFDLRQYRVENYPVEVTSTGSTVKLFLTAIGTAFERTLSASGETLEGTGTAGGETESIVFRRNGSAQFSEGFLALEAAADDPSLVLPLSDDGSELRARFNEDVNRTRLLMLLAPT